MSHEALLPEVDRKCSIRGGDGSNLEHRCIFLGDQSAENPESASQEQDMALHSGWRSWWLVRWARLRIVDPLYLIVSRGTEPKQLAFSAALGFTLGIFPIYGVTVILCACAAVLLGFRCHAPTLMLANLIATPIELSLIVPFLRTGEWVTGGKRLLLTKSALWRAVTGRASTDVLLGLLHALMGWLVFAPLIVFGLYVVFVPAMKYATRRFGPEYVRQQLPSQRQVFLKDIDLSESVKSAIV